MKTTRELSPQFIWGVVAISLSVLIVSGMFTINSSLAHESQTQQWGYVKYVHTNVNIRAGRSTEHQVVGLLFAGESIRADFLQDNWYAVFKIDERDRSISRALGYVYASLLKPNPPPLPSHRIISQEDVSFGTVIRLQIRVVVPEHYSKSQIEILSRTITNYLSKDKAVNAIALFFHGPNSSTSGVPDVARVEWAPNGRWSDADTVSPGNYATFRYSVNYNEPVRQAPIQPQRQTLRRSSSKGLLGVPLPTGARLVSSKPGDSWADPEETYQINATGAQIIDFYNREMIRDGWKRAGWGNSTYEKVFEKGSATIAILSTAGGKTFTLWGSGGRP